jgi:hypothetical protein
MPLPSSFVPRAWRPIFVWSAAALTSLTWSASAIAFEPGIHAEITHVALGDATSMSRKLTFEALLEISLANVGEDEPWLHVLPHVHVDSENILAAHGRVAQKRRSIIGALLADPVNKASEARELMGEAFHTIQDFYSHTTWVEQALPGHAHLGEPFPDPAVFVSPSLARMCEGSSGTFPIYPAPLTSGYFLLAPRLDAEAARIGKCIHGLLIPGVGINKDHPGRTGHGRARILAILATKSYFESIVSELRGQQRDDAICGLLGHSVETCAGVPPPSDYSILAKVASFASACATAHLGGGCYRTASSSLASDSISVSLVETGVSYLVESETRSQSALSYSVEEVSPRSATIRLTASWQGSSELRAQAPSSFNYRGGSEGVSFEVALPPFPPGSPADVLELIVTGTPSFSADGAPPCIGASSSGSLWLRFQSRNSSSSSSWDRLVYPKSPVPSVDLLRPEQIGQALPFIVERGGGFRLQIVFSLGSSHTGRTDQACSAASASAAGSFQGTVTIRPASRGPFDGHYLALRSIGGYGHVVGGSAVRGLQSSPTGQTFVPLLATLSPSDSDPNLATLSGTASGSPLNPDSRIVIHPNGDADLTWSATHPTLGLLSGTSRAQGLTYRITGPWSGTWFEARAGGNVSMTVATHGAGGQEIQGYFDHLCTSGGPCSGREHFVGGSDGPGRYALVGTHLQEPNNIGIARYAGTLSADGRSITGFIYTPEENVLVGAWSVARAGTAPPQIVLSAPTLVPVNPRATYLRTNSDPGAANAVAIDLSALGLGPGDVVQLSTVGAFSVGAGRPEDANVLAGVFSLSAVLAHSTNLNRVIGAVDSGFDIETPPTFQGSLATDIPQDFAFRNILAEIPPGARFLFVAAPDSAYSDNNDSDGDFALSIRALKFAGD